MTFHPLCRQDELQPGEARMFVVDDQPVGLFRIGDEWIAIDNRCPHAGASLAHGLVEKGVVTCRIHHWRFRLCDGRYLDEDRPQADRQRFPVRLRKGMVEVELPE